MRFKRLAQGAMVGALLFSMAAKCPNDTGQKTKNGQRIISPLLADVVLVAHWLPGSEVATITISVPRLSRGIQIDQIGGYWQNGYAGRHNAFMEVRPHSRLSSDDWWGECRVFLRRPDGTMFLADIQETHNREAVRCSADGTETIRA